MKRRGGEVLAIAVDPPASAARVVADDRLPFPILCDVDRSVCRAYGLLHERGSPEGTDIAIPAQVLIEPSGRIVWTRPARTVQDRPDPEETLDAIRRCLP
jgi:peroxiredoxin